MATAAAVCKTHCSACDLVARCQSAMLNAAAAGASGLKAGSADCGALAAVGLAAVGLLTFAVIGTVDDATEEEEVGVRPGSGNVFVEPFVSVGIALLTVAGVVLDVDDGSAGSAGCIAGLRPIAAAATAAAAACVAP